MSEWQPPTNVRLEDPLRGLLQGSGQHLCCGRVAQLLNVLLKPEAAQRDIPGSTAQHGMARET